MDRRHQARPERAVEVTRPKLPHILRCSSEVDAGGELELPRQVGRELVGVGEIAGLGVEPHFVTVARVRGRPEKRHHQRRLVEHQPHDLGVVVEVGRPRDFRRRARLRRRRPLHILRGGGAGHGRRDFLEVCDESVNVRVEGRQPDGGRVPAQQRPEGGRHLLVARHARVVEQRRNHLDVRCSQRGLDLAADVILAAACAFAQELRPPPPDQCQQHRGARALGADLVDPTHAGLQVHDIQEDVLGTKVPGEPVVQEAGVRSRIIAPIVDEDLQLSVPARRRCRRRILISVDVVHRRGGQRVRIVLHGPDAAHVSRARRKETLGARSRRPAWPQRRPSQLLRRNPSSALLQLTLGPETRCQE